MAHHRSDVVARAIDVLDRYGLADLSMRRLAGELGVAPSALYHHFPNKQTLLAAVADEILLRSSRPARASEWDERAIETCNNLRDSMLAYRDGAELVATVRAFGLGAAAVAIRVRAALDALPDSYADAATSTLVHFVIGHTIEEQTQLQAESVGAIVGTPAGLADRSGTAFDAGLALIVAGIRAGVSGH